MQKELGAQSFVVKTSGLLKSNRSTTKTFYFAENFDEVDSTNVSGVLINMGQIKQTVDFFTGASSYGGFNIEVLRIQNTIDDLLDDYYFYNRPIYIYYHIEGQTRNTAVPNLQLVYSGKIEDATINHDKALFSVINDHKLLERKFPPIINDANAGSANGKVAQYVYGTHATNYGKNDATGTPKQNNNLIKAIPAGGGSNPYRWIVAGNGADISIAASGAMWIWNSEYKRYMQVSTSYTVDTDTQGNKIIYITPQQGYFVKAYDYIMPSNVARAGTPNWTSPANAINDNFNIFDSAGYAQLNVTYSDGGDSYLYIDFSNVPTYATESKSVMFGVDDDGIQLFTISGYGATSDIKSISGYATRSITAADGSLPTRITFRGQQDAAEDNNWARVSNCFYRLETKVIEIKDVYIAATNSKDTQREIIADIASNIGVNYADNVAVDAITMSPLFDRQDNAINHIKEVARQGACAAVVSGNNQLTVDKINLSASADFTFNIADIDIYTVKPSLSDTRHIINDAIVNYYYDNYTGGLSKVLPDKNNISDSIFGMMEGVINADFITDSANAGALLDYYVNGDNATFFSEKRSIVEFETINIRGTIPYTAGGVLQAIIALELGDHFSLPANLDNYITCNGESWSGKVFKIIGYGLNAGKIWIKGIEI